MESGIGALLGNGGGSGGETGSTREGDAGKCSPAGRVAKRREAEVAVRAPRAGAAGIVAAPMEPGLGLQERAERLLRRSEALLCQRPPPPRAPPGRGREGRGLEAETGSQDALQLWRAARRRGYSQATPPVTSREGRGSPEATPLGERRGRCKWQGAELEDYNSHDALRPWGRGYGEEAPWGRAVGQEEAGEVLELDSDEAEAPEDAVLRALRGRRRALRGLLRAVETLLAAPHTPAPQIWGAQ